MSYVLVVVESPNKVKKIKSLLGEGYKVVATLGHFVDLPSKDLGVDLFTMTPSYESIAGKGDIAKRLSAEAQAARSVILATDPDREGEAIAWHVARTIGDKANSAKRARFHEITKDAISKAIAAAGPIDYHLVDAQQARRVMDRLCGYQISPLLWPFGKGLSAGRVQSAALHLVVEREKKRRAFAVEKFFEVRCGYTNGLAAVLFDREAKTTKRFYEQATANLVVAELQRDRHRVVKIDQNQTQQNPKPPFTTSSLQQVASSLLKFSPDETMAVAQSLFELGCITYHRTDSVNLSDEAVALARSYIADIAPEALPPQPPKYKSKASSQEAHEAIRPTSLVLDSSLSADAAALWQIIHDRFLASQCKPAVISVAAISIESGAHCLIAKTRKVLDPGYQRFWQTQDESDLDDEEHPPETDIAVKNEETLEARETCAKAVKTAPPPRFTEATLVRDMERYGIGRPSTYAATIKLLLGRNYVALQKRLLIPTELGELVNKLLGQGFSTLLSPTHTAEWEEHLDAVARGRQKWKVLCLSYQAGLQAQIDRARGLFAIPDAEKCKKCGAPMQTRNGPRGKFLGCSAFPKCRHSQNVSASSQINTTAA